ncbi:hypothetical protein LTR97_003487 [Elasticomyces elasticus]|uniref:Uncharacterized protein n=1 Tax=Elasticomyces elasticus TaxID=574655 RepID=A0AAN7ZP86_9PEZI|nr:hypothetical protein LTR97_003487 [Elasticomyces elasticus]
MPPTAIRDGRMSIHHLLTPQSHPIATASHVLGEGSSTAAFAQSAAPDVPICAGQKHPRSLAAPSLERRMGDYSPYAPASPPSSTTSETSDAMSTRAPRPSYSEEQRFFIMYTRVVLCWSWQDIELGYGRLFGQDAVGLRSRSRGGLTSVYYRIRRRWGLEEVLKTAPETSQADKLEVQRRANWLQPDFLMQIGYHFAPQQPIPVLSAFTY